MTTLPVLKGKRPAYEYAPGTWGPEQAAGVSPSEGELFLSNTTAL